MPLWSLTKERVQDLQKQLEAKEKELEDLECTSPEELWERDLDAILDELDALDLRASMTAEEEKRICRSAKRAGDFMGRSGKRARASAPNTQPVPMTMTRGNIASSASFRELQQRQLSSSSEKFPSLFQDAKLKPASTPQSQLPMQTGGGPPRPSFGNFAQRAMARSQTAGSAPQRQATDPSGLYAGASVTLSGLSLADMNGRRGTVRRRDDESGRWEVEVDGQGVKRLKTENLKLVGSK